MIDYIFYRVYRAYKKKGEAAKVLSLLYMTMSLAFFFYPFAAFLGELLRDSLRRNDGYLFFIYFLMVLIFSYLRFLPRKRVGMINKRFDKYRLNRVIPDWCFFMVLPFCVVWGITVYILLVRFVIKPFVLRGMIYDLLTNYFYQL